MEKWSGEVLCGARWPPPEQLALWLFHNRGVTSHWGVSMRTSYSWQDKHLTHHITYTWLMTVPQSEGSPHTHRKSLPRPLPSLLHIWGNAARWKQDGRKSLRNKQILRQVPSFSTRHLGVASASISREEDFVHSGRLGPNRIKSGNSTQWFPNALCVLKVPESYLGFHYYMGILALDGMQTEINSLLILQGNQYRDCYCFEARDSQACPSFIRSPLLYRWIQAQHTEPSLIPIVYSFPKCLLRLGHDEVFHPTVSQV